MGRVRRNEGVWIGSGGMRGVDGVRRSGGVWGHQEE